MQSSANHTNLKNHKEPTKLINLTNLSNRIRGHYLINRKANLLNMTMNDLIINYKILLK